MKKKIFILVILVVLISGSAFADRGKNTITVDVGPTITGLAIAGIGGLVGEDGVSSSGFGIAAQYERELIRIFSLAARFSYMGGGMGYKFTESGLSAITEINLDSISVEAHARLYPFAGKFFIDGMLGYANITSTFSGKIVGKDELQNVELINVSTPPAMRHYLKYGAKTGLRNSFGKNGGFTFETSLGWYGHVETGDTLGKQLAKDVGVDVDVSDFDEMFKLIERFVFIGGPRLTLAIGWRF